MFRLAITKHFQIVKNPRIMAFFTVQHKYWFLCNLWNYEQYYYYRQVCYIIYPISNAAITQNGIKMGNLEH